MLSLFICEHLLAPCSAQPFIFFVNVRDGWSFFSYWFLSPGAVVLSPQIWALKYFLVALNMVARNRKISFFGG